MAITRTQIAKQLLANGGRIGFRVGTEGTGMPEGTGPKGTIGGPNIGASLHGNDKPNFDKAFKERKRRQDLKDIANRIAEDKAQEPYETLIIKDSELPGISGLILDQFKGPRQSILNKNIDYFRGLKSRGRLNDLRYSANAQGYRNYMADRQAGLIDAAGNPIMGGDEDNNNIIPIIPQTTMGGGGELAELEPEEQEPFELFRRFKAEGGIMDGNIDEMGRQMYGLGKLVKKVTRGVKKIAKSPIGKAALLYTGAAGLGALGAGTGFKGFLSSLASPSTIMGNLAMGGRKLGILKSVQDYGMSPERVGPLAKLFDSPLGLIAGASAVAGLLTPEQEAEAQMISDETGIDIAEIRANPDKYLGRRFRAEGGCMKEPVAKKTMPLLDMGGQEMDLRAEGGFVPIGRMEKADDVPARLSKNEFVFTADAVRNAGDGNVDKGAEVMYNMMKNLESGGDVSEESQGLEGARKMFQTSQRLEEVL